jgi:hypothetical protein
VHLTTLSVAHPAETDITVISELWIEKNVDECDRVVICGIILVHSRETEKGHEKYSDIVADIRVPILHQGFEILFHEKSLQVI